jgi:hypothetical protein
MDQSFSKNEKSKTCNKLVAKIINEEQDLGKPKKLTLLRDMEVNNPTGVARILTPPKFPL